MTAAFTMILLALDETEHSRRAVGLAIEIALRFDAEVLVERVVEEDESTTEGMVDDLVGAELGRLRHAGVTARAEVRSGIGPVGDQLVAAAVEHGADLMVMGSRALSDVSALMVGSTTHRVLQQAPCPVLVVR